MAAVSHKQFMVGDSPVSILSFALAAFASMGGFLYGYDTGYIADILIMPDFLERFADVRNGDNLSFSNVRSGLTVGLLSVGTLFGALGGSYISDGVGRRKAIAVYCLCVDIGFAVQIASSTSWIQFVVGRVIAGLGIGGISAIVPVYQGETADKRLRGTLTATYQWFNTFGILISYCFAIGTKNLGGAAAWRLLIGLGMVVATTLGVGILFMVESPRHLMRIGDQQGAKLALSKLRGVSIDQADPYVEHDYEEILNAIEEEKREGRGTWLECFGPILWRRTVVGMMLQFFQILTGINYFFYFGAQLFVGVGLGNSYVTQIILGAVNTFTTFPGLIFLEKFGRRNTLIWGGLWQFAWLMAFAITGTVADPYTNKSLGSFMIAAACFFIAGFASTWGPVVWALMGETFPSRTRAKQAGLGTATNWVVNFGVAFATPFVTNKIGFAWGFVFAGSCLFSVFFVYFFLKETSGLSLEAIDQMWMDSSVAPWKSAKWVPPGYSHRRDAVESIPQEKRLRVELEHKEYAGEKPGDVRMNEYAADEDRTPVNSTPAASVKQTA